jgi:hypothetical protein
VGVSLVSADILVSRYDAFTANKCAKNLVIWGGVLGSLQEGTDKRVIPGTKESG